MTINSAEKLRLLATVFEQQKAKILPVTAAQLREIAQEIDDFRSAKPSECHCSECRDLMLEFQRSKFRG